MEDPLLPEEKEALWKQFLAGNAMTAEQLCRQYMKPLALYCLKFVKDADTASDIATDALLKIRSYAKDKKIEQPERLLYTIAKNKCLTIYRNESNRRNILATLLPFFSFTQKPEVESDIAQEDIDTFLQQVWDTNDSLTAMDAHIWELHQEGYKNQEIAEILDLDIALVGRRKHYIRKVLKEAIEKKRKNKGPFLPVWLFFAGLWEVIYFGLNNIRIHVYTPTATQAA